MEKLQTEWEVKPFDTQPRSFRIDYLLFIGGKHIYIPYRTITDKQSLILGSHEFPNRGTITLEGRVIKITLAEGTGMYIEFLNPGTGVEPIHIVERDDTNRPYCYSDFYAIRIKGGQPEIAIREIPPFAQCQQCKSMYPNDQAYIEYGNLFINKDDFHCRNCGSGAKPVTGWSQPQPQLWKDRYLEDCLHIQANCPNCGKAFLIDTTQLARPTLTLSLAPIINPICPGCLNKIPVFS
jgi:Zn finger protein HypA/HybF involved in hydrogenase expression